MRPDSAASRSGPRPSPLFSLASLTTLLLLLPSSTTAFDCDDIPAQGVHFHLKELGGPKSVHWLDRENHDDGRLSNYTFTIDICRVLQWEKGTDKKTNCELGSQVCGIREDIDESGTINSTIIPISIAGNYGRGREIDEQFELFRNGKSHADSDRDGFRAELHGGMFNGRKQQAIIEFVCDKNRTGLEGHEKDGGDKDENKDGDKDGKDKDGKTERLRTRADDGCEDSDNSLRFCKYDRTSEVQTLRLQWRTQHACEEDASAGSDSTGWGFFTWLFVIVFLATASYLIFGSWLNYNRYGARGWDLLPHGDTIRDVPYILKDWGRRVTNTLQGPSSRGGYSAV